MARKKMIHIANNPKAANRMKGVLRKEGRSNVTIRAKGEKFAVSSGRKLKHRGR